MLCQILLRFSLSLSVSVSVSVSVSISISLSSVQTAAAFTPRTPIPRHDATPDSAWLRGGRNDLEDGLFDGAIFGHLDLQLHHIPTRGSTHKPCAASGTGMRARRCDKSAGERASERLPLWVWDKGCLNRGNKVWRAERRAVLYLFRRPLRSYQGRRRSWGSHSGPPRSEGGTRIRGGVGAERIAKQGTFAAPHWRGNTLPRRTGEVRENNLTLW